MSTALLDDYSVPMPARELGTVRNSRHDAMCQAYRDARDAHRALFERHRKAVLVRAMYPEYGDTFRGH